MRNKLVRCFASNINLINGFVAALARMILSRGMWSEMIPNDNDDLSSDEESESE